MTGVVQYGYEAEADGSRMVWTQLKRTDILGVTANWNRGAPGLSVQIESETRDEEEQMKDTIRKNQSGQGT